MGESSSSSSRFISLREQDYEKELDTCVKDGVLDKDKLFNVLEQMTKIPVNIGVIGQAGCGKSSLIDVLVKATPPRNYEEEKKIKKQLKNCQHASPEKCKHLYAPKDSSECTVRATPFTFQEETDQSVIVWDLPGYGAELHPNVETYFEQFNILGKYDVLIFVMRDNRVTPDTQEVLRKLMAMEKRFIIARTFFDVAIKRDFPVVSEKDKKGIFKDEKKKACKEIKKQLNVEFKDVYAISGHYFPDKDPNLKFEIDGLRDAILEKLPPQKQAIAGTALGGWTKKALDAKFRKIQGLTAALVLSSASVSGATSLIPIVNIIGAVASGVTDVAMLTLFNKQVAKIYNFNEDGNLLDSTEVDEKTKEFVKVQLSGKISAALLTTIARVGAVIAASTVTEAAVGLIPFVGAAVSAAFSGSTMAWACHKINKIYYNAAMEVGKSAGEQDIYAL